MKSSSFFVAVIFIAVVLAGCRPYDKPEFVEISSNETAFIVPLSGKTSSQSAFMSEDYLRENMVATKRVQIPHEWVQTGRGSNTGIYKPSVMVIKVDRTPVSESWGTGAGTKIGVESKESIGFTIPISLTAMIEQDDAPKFLYKYTDKKPLRDVVNSDVNAFVRTQASQKFGVYSLEECKQHKKDILESIFSDAKVFFKTYGITISQFGMTDGFIYDSAEIQTAIDKQAILQAEGKALSEKESNAIKQRGIDLKNAENEAQIAATKASSVNALKALQEVENSKILAQAQADAIVEFAKNADLPAVIPESSFYQLGLDKLIPTSGGKK